jgi:RNA polymerase primary sigma factor
MDEVVKAEGYMSNYTRDILRYPLLSGEEEKLLIEQYQNGNKKAGERLLLSNLRFVLFVGRQLEKKSPLPFEDLVAEGNVGLLEALERFDTSRGVKFITYAVWWVRQAMVQAIQEKGRTVRLPAHQFSRFRKIKKEDHGEDVQEESVKETIAFIHGGTISLDRSMGDGEPITLLDTLRWNGTKPDDEYSDDQRNQKIDEIFMEFSDREVDILCKYFGLRGEEEMTLEEIGNVFSISKERVRQIKEKVLEKIRHRHRTLYEYLWNN